jgi:uncharacterized protein YfdQ (DUF2303 family)
MNPSDLKTTSPAAGEQIIADLARRAEVATATPRSGSYKDAAPFLVLRDGSGTERVEFLKERLEEPKRKSGIVQLHDAGSFITFVGIHGTAGAPIYATLKPAQFVAILNDHTKTEAGWRDHRAVFQVAHSHEWTTWLNHNGRDQAFNSNESFAIFLEENSPDIIRPDSAAMVNIALNFKVKADVGFSVAQRLEDGNIELSYANVVNATARNAAGNSVRIPGEFTIEIPVWDGPAAKKYRVDARFRYRLHETKLTLWYELVRPHKVIEQAFKDLWQQVEKETKSPILYGKAD